VEVVSRYEVLGHQLGDEPIVAGINSERVFTVLCDCNHPVNTHFRARKQVHDPRRVASTYELDKSANIASLSVDDHCAQRLGARERGTAMRILVTNDDGIDAPGLLAVAAALHKAGHDVVVGAPIVESSGSGTSLGTLEHGAIVAVESRRLPGLASLEAFAFDCPPAFTVLAFCAGQFGPPPDLVVSGINPGHNTGRSVLFSSTVGAVLTAQIAGVGGVAVSCGFAPSHRFDTAAEVAVRVVQWIADNDARGLTLNVNVPDTDFDQLDGVRVATLGARSLLGLKMTRVVDGVELQRYDNTTGLSVGTDAAAVLAGSVAITALTTVGADQDAAATTLSSVVDTLSTVNVASPI
jgi:5'-nucleotidase